jgi:hypothetical protein
LTDFLAGIVSLVTDSKALVAILGLIVSTVVAMISVADKEKRPRATLTIFACVAFAAGTIGTWQQHVTSETETIRSDEARIELAKIRVK